MNYSAAELSAAHKEDEDLIEDGLDLLPVIGASLFSGISHLGQAYRLTPAQVKVLLQLGARERMTVGEVAAGLGVSMPAASELVDRLVEAGHVVRAADPGDRRRVLVAATPESRRIGAELRELRRAQLRRALDQLEPAERPVFVRALRALVTGLNVGTDAAPLCYPVSQAGSGPSENRPESPNGGCR